MRRLLSACCLVVFALLLAAGSAPAQTSPSPLAAVQAPGGFGAALAADGTTLFVGDPASVHAPGRVVIYRRDGDDWTEAARLEASDAEVGDGFGQALAVDGDRLVVGAPAAGETGAVYVFERGEDGWTQSVRLTPAAGVNGQFGGAVAVRGGTLVAGVTDPPFTFDPGRGGAVLFQQTNGTWIEGATLLPDDVQKGDGFGRSLAATGAHVFVGAPSADGRAGAVHVYAQADGEWTRTQILAEMKGRFGAALHAAGNDVAVGIPGANGGIGAAKVVRWTGDTWAVAARYLPYDAPTDGGFGTAVALAPGADGTAGRLWIGAPGAQDGTGALYVVEREDGASGGSVRHVSPTASTGDRLGAAVTAGAWGAAAGVPGADYGAYMSGRSRVAVYDRAASAWRPAPLEPPSREIFSALTGEERDCTDGSVSVFDCQGVDLLSFLPIEELGGARGVRLNDVWGWTDPETGRDYALVGRVDGTAFVDVTDPTAPVYVGELPKTEGSAAKIWRDVKVYQNHAFVVADNAGRHGMQVFDLTQLRDVDPADRPVTFEETARYDGIHSAHNVFVNEDTGFAYIVAANGGGRTCGGGLHMVDVRDPVAPTFAGCFADPSTGRTGTGTTHDTQCVVYEGPDAEYQGREICFSANETAVSIADVTDKKAPKAISTASHPRSAYVHQGWLTDDQRYLYVNDELDEMSGLVDRTRTLIFDVAELDDPQLVTEFFLSTPSSDHNLYLRGTTMYQANYTSGLRVLDVSDPENPKEVGHFDTLPFGPDRPGFEGAFSNYPFFESGVVVVTSMQEGMFVLKKAETEL